MALLAAAACAPPVVTADGGGDAASDGPAAVESSADGPSGATDATDATGPCGLGAHAADDGACTTDVRWTMAAAYPAALDHHTTFIRESAGGAAIYVLGGARATHQTLAALSATVRRAAIAADGTVGAWTPMESLPHAAFGHGMSVVNDRVYVTGGVGPSGTSAEATVDTFVGTIAADGSLGSWQTSAPLPSPRFHHITVVVGQNLYAIGGRSSLRTQDVMSEVVRAPIMPDGALGAWTAATPLPMPLGFHSAFAYEGAVYVVGGITTGNAAIMPVLRAAVMADGSLEAWRTVGTIDQGVFGHSTTLRGAELYIIGGQDAYGQVTDRVVRATLAPDGTVGGWDLVADALPAARAHVHQRPLYRQRFYSVGGSDPDHTSVSDVVIGELY